MLSLLGRKAKPGYPAPPPRAARRCESWGLTLGHWRPATLTSTLTPKPLQDSWGHPSSEHVDDIYCTVEFTAPSVISRAVYMCRQMGVCVCVVSGHRFYRGKLAFCYMLHYWKRSLAYKGPFEQSCAIVKVCWLSQAPPCAADSPSLIQIKSMWRGDERKRTIADKVFLGVCVCLCVCVCVV